MTSKLAKLAQAAALGLAFAFTLSCDKGGGNVKLLESITDENGNIISKYEYDKQNRIAKINDETIIYANNAITVGTKKFVINGNTINVDGESFTINKDGYIIDGDSYIYKYEKGNLVGMESKLYDEKIFSYDDKNSPFSNSPKWLIQYLIDETRASKNNILTYSYKGANTYKYEYDSDGFPTKVTEWKGWSDETLPPRYYFYRGQTPTIPTKTETNKTEIQYEK